MLYIRLCCDLLYNSNLFCYNIEKYMSFGKVYVIQIKMYDGQYASEIIALILDIQNNESKIHLSLEEQPDLLDIHENYHSLGGK